MIFEMKENSLTKILEGLNILEKLSNGHLTDWKYALESANSIWSRSPFKVGDLVKLNKTPEITKDKSWGWLGAKHFLVEGALAEVKSRQFYDGKFIFGLMFNDDSWIDYNGNIHYVNERYIYSFSEDWLMPANYDQLSCEAL